MVSVTVWVLLGFVGILNIGIIWAVIGFIYKKRTKVIVIMPDKKKVTKVINGALSDFVEVDGGKYKIDDLCLVRAFWGEELYYYYNNPLPIYFDLEKNRPKDVGTSSKDLKNFDSSTLIERLFALKDSTTLLIILLIVVIILNIVGLYAIFTSNKPVELSASGNNTRIIVDAIRIAMRPT